MTVDNHIHYVKLKVSLDETQNVFIPEKTPLNITQSYECIFGKVILFGENSGPES